jgi:SOS-response transcriptional repressor LexA
MQDTDIETYGITPMQRIAALVIHELTEADGRPPSIGEIAGELDVCRSTAHALIAGLRDRGWLTWRRNQKRSIRLLKAPAPLAETPVEVTPAGRMAAAEAARPDLSFSGA